MANPLRRLLRYAAIAVLVLLCVIGAALAATQTGWFKSYLRRVVERQAGQFLNGAFTVQHLGGSIFTGVELDGVALVQEGQRAVVIDKLTVSYSPITLVREGLILTSVTLDRPNVRLARSDAGWNFNRFVKTRQNTGGKGAPPITITTLAVNDGRVLVTDHAETLEDITQLNSRLRFAYQKPGIEFEIAQLSGRSRDVNINALAGILRFEGGGTSVRNLAVETDRSRLMTTFSWAAGTSPLSTRAMDVLLHADRLWLPEIGLFFKPIATIRLAPALDVRGHGTLEALAMDVNVISSEGNAKGPIVGRFAGPNQGINGRLDAEHVNVEHLVNRPEWKTFVTGRADFDWKFGRATAVGTGAPMVIRFKFAGPDVRGFGYGAADVRAEGVYTAPDLTLDATGAAYGATASTKASFHFPATGPMSYDLAGVFRSVDMRRLPASLSMPKLATQASGTYRFTSDGRNWRGDGTMDDAVVENARFAPGTLFEIDSTGKTLHYSGSGSVAALDPQRFAGPLDIDWLADKRFRGLLTGTFTFDGSGKTTDALVLTTSADLTNSEMAGAHFPKAHATMEMRDRQLHSSFAGNFEQLPGTLFTDQAELADTQLNGSADMTVALTIPAVGDVTIDAIDGSTELAPSTVAGLALEQGQVAVTYANQIATIRRLDLAGPAIVATATGTLALGSTGESNLKYDLVANDLTALGKRFSQPVTGGAHIAGEATGPASKLELKGTIEANRFAYSTSMDALAAKSTYTATVPDFDIKGARIDADSTATFVTLAGNSLPRITAKTTYTDGELGFDASLEQEKRSLALGGRVLIHPDHHEVHLRALNVKVGDTLWALPSGREATVQYSPTAITIEEFVLQRGNEQVTATGTVAIGSATDTVPNNLNVLVNNVQVRDINELMLGTRALDGLLNGKATIGGTRSDPRLQATFALTGGNVEGVTFESLAGTASYEGRAADVDLTLEQNSSATLTAKGIVPLPSGPGVRARAEEFDLAVKSSPIDVALFQPATTQLSKLSGQLEADVKVRGTLESPKLDGRIDVTNAGFTVEATSVAYSNALARLSFEGDLVLVDRFEVSDEDRDKLVAIGQVSLVRHSVGAMNMQLSASQFKMLDNVYGHVEADADLRVTGDAEKPQVSGTISSRNGRVEVDQLLEQLTKSAYSTKAAVVITETPGTAAAAVGGAAPAPVPAPKLGVYDAATVDVHVLLPDDLVLRGRDMQTSYSRIGLGNMNITVGGDLNIRKKPAGEPDIVGTVSVVRGYYEFQGRRFDVLRDSQIRFQGLEPLDPALQVGAQRQISGVTAIVNIRGTARQPSITLSSQPPLDEADVLSLIVFNQPINQLGAGERLNLAQRAGSMAAGYITTPLSNSIANALDLDLFEIRPEGGINGQPSVALGQQFGSRLFVQFKQEFGSEDRSELSFEYRISELLRLVSTVTQGAQQSHRTQRVDSTGADLIFVLSY